MGERLGLLHGQQRTATLLVLISAVVFASGCRSIPKGAHTHPTLLNSPPPAPIGQTAKAKLQDVVVGLANYRLDLPPDDGNNPNEEILGDKYINSELAKQFHSITTENWLQNFNAYKYELVKRASDGGFDSVALEQCLKKVLPPANEDWALLPVAAFVSEVDGMPVWVVVCVWEIASQVEDDNGPYWRKMMHVCGWAFRMSDLKQLAFFTCA